MTHSGGCLCGALRYEVSSDPLSVVVCFFHFCQRATGSQGMVEPIFDVTAFRFAAGDPKCYTHVSAGSGEEVYVHFCADCGTKTHLTFARWPTRLGVYAGTFDDPGWFDLTPGNSRYIFLDSAARGTLVPAGVKTYRQHSYGLDGAPRAPVILDEVLHLR